MHSRGQSDIGQQVRHLIYQPGFAPQHKIWSPKRVTQVPLGVTRKTKKEKIGKQCKCPECNK